MIVNKAFEQFFVTNVIYSEFVFNAVLFNVVFYL